jgi:dUTP pyrophosphatase
MPEKRDEDAGWDLFATKRVAIWPGRTEMVPLGIKTEFSENFFALLRDRSSMAKNGLGILAGVIDSGFRGEWKAMIHNGSTESRPHIVEVGDKVAQFCILPVPKFELIEVTELAMSERGEGGFGSTGR